VLMAMVLRGDPPPGEHSGRSVRANAGTNMEMATPRAPGPAPERTAGTMSARNNPFFAPAHAGPGPHDTGMPTGANAPSTGTSQPKATKTADFVPLRHAHTYPRRSR
jgi:hypothetical protein